MERETDGSTLREALLELTVESPYRGSERHERGAFTYAVAIGDSTIAQRRSGRTRTLHLAGAFGGQATRFA